MNTLLLPKEERRGEELTIGLCPGGAQVKYVLPAETHVDTPKSSYWGTSWSPRKRMMALLCLFKLFNVDLTV